MQNKIQTGLILRNEKANLEYTTQNLTRIYSEEGKGVFTVRHNVLGHMQQVRQWKAILFTVLGPLTFFVSALIPNH